MTSLKLPEEEKNTKNTVVEFNVNIDEVVNKVSKSDGRKIMIALDGTEYSSKAVSWVKNNLLRNEDCIVLVTVWEEAMLNKLYSELDSELIHPSKDINKSHSKHNLLKNTYSKAQYLKSHPNVQTLLIESHNRINPKNIGQEIIEISKKMKIDVIVCGTRGLSGIKKAVLGSVSTYLSNNSECTCIIVKV